MMRLVVDTNVLVAELLRHRGRALIGDSRLLLCVTEQIIDETKYELQQRIVRMISNGRLNESTGNELLDSGFDVLQTYLRVFKLETYEGLETKARSRIPRDQNDWQTVALALHLEAAIWTQDYDFFGCGCATWTTETLLLYLQSLG
ncbi:MAG: PIN domain-containing protein [Nostoc sp. ChiSLP02]|nr:PIN domain-containing protein [Nostoc sp. DedSLP05]MDZ8099622.1 PIN domain-containing protein [Nostoc sp. DedSLP01]MDZ8186122.1 PIN domain-containing protein [Nostoc sp. ChiSLP02]